MSCKTRGEMIRDWRDSAVVAPVQECFLGLKEYRVVSLIEIDRAVELMMDGSPGDDHIEELREAREELRLAKMQVNRQADTIKSDGEKLSNQWKRILELEKELGELKDLHRPKNPSGDDPAAILQRWRAWYEGDDPKTMTKEMANIRLTLDALVEREQGRK